MNVWIASATADEGFEGGLVPDSTLRSAGNWRCQGSEGRSWTTAASYFSGYAIANCGNGFVVELSFVTDNRTEDGGNPENPFRYHYPGTSSMPQLDTTISGSKRCLWFNTTSSLSGTDWSTTCPSGPAPNMGFGIANNEFMLVANCIPSKGALEPQGAECNGGAPVVSTTKPCDGYANVLPWRSAGLQRYDTISIPAQTPVKWRYITKHRLGSATTGERFVMVHNVQLNRPANSPAWVFLPRSCLPAELPVTPPNLPNEPGDHYYCPSLTVVQNQQGACDDLPEVAEVVHGAPPSAPPASPDRDQDGVSNASDACPEDRGPAAYGGCPPQRPAALLLPGGNQAIFFRAPNGQIVESFYDGVWRSYGLSEPGTAAGQPSGFVFSDGRHAVFYRGTDSHIHQLYYDGQWHHWDLGGSAAGDPVASLYSGGNQSVFYRGTDGTMRELFYDGRWQNFGLGGSPAGDPALINFSNGDKALFYRHVNGSVHELLYTNGAWHNFGLGGSIKGDPTALRLGTNEQLVWYRGVDNRIRQLHYDGSWRLNDLGGESAGDPHAMTSGSDQIVFYRGTENGIKQLYYSGAAHRWYNWHLGGSAAGDPAILPPGGIQAVFYAGTNGALNQGYYSNGWQFVTLPGAFG